MSNFQIAPTVPRAVDGCIGLVNVHQYAKSFGVSESGQWGIEVFHCEIIPKKFGTFRTMI